MNQNQRFGEWLRQRFHLSGETLEQLVDTQKHHHTFIGSLAIESGIIDPDALAYHLHHDPEAPENPLPFISDFNDVTNIADWLNPTTFIEHGFLILGRRQRDVIIACLRWPSPNRRHMFETLFDQPVQFILVSRYHWYDLLEATLHNPFHHHIPGIDLQPFEPPVINQPLEPDHPWSPFLLDCIRRKRTYLTLNRQDLEAWTDFHTPQIPLKPFDVAHFNIIYRTLRTIETWHQPAWLPPHQVYTDMTIGNRKIRVLAEFRQGFKRIWLHFRLVEPRRLLSSVFRSRDIKRLLDLWKQWLGSAPNGAWLISLVPSPLNLSAFLSLMSAFRTAVNGTFIGVDDSFGGWPELDTVIPFAALNDILEDESLPRKVIIARWDWNPERLQELFLISTRFPLFFIIESPTAYHAMSTLWHHGFESIIHAGRIHGWLNLVETRRNCDWCAESRHPSETIELHLGPRPVRIDVGETWRQSLICESCKDLVGWQSATLEVEWGVLPVQEMRNLRNHMELFHLMTSRTPRPIWVPIIKNTRQGRIDGSWTSGFMAGLAALQQAPAETKE